MSAQIESTLGVGIIGVSPVRGWATTAHIPALRALPSYEIRALSAHSAESARAAGEAFKVSAVFSNHEQLVTQPDIDVVAVTVKVPHHRELVSAALAAGKAVYCEWPLGRDLDEARGMAALAAKQRVRTVVGLQARQAPAIEFVQELLRDGYVGEVLSTTMVGISVPGDVVVKPNAYMLDKANGANLLTIALGHSLDTLNYLLGEFDDLWAVSDLRRVRSRHRPRDEHRAGLRRRRPPPRGHRHHREVRRVSGTRDGVGQRPRSRSTSLLRPPTE